jgi:hypothetical protein
MISTHVNSMVASAVLAAKESGSTLTVAKVAHRLATAAGCPDQSEEIADALLREGIRQRIPMEIGGRRPG